MRDHDSHPVSCEVYDYIELACLYRYTLAITLTNGGVMEAVAINTKIHSNLNNNKSQTDVNAPKKEFLVAEVNQKRVEIALNEIAHIQALDPGAKFGLIRF